MLFNHRIALRLAALALPLLISATALARDADRTPDRTTGSGAQSEEPLEPPAPVGHRQPRAADLPATTARDRSDEWLDRINRETDRKLQICRGC